MKASWNPSAQTPLMRFTCTSLLARKQLDYYKGSQHPDRTLGGMENDILQSNQAENGKG